MKAYRVKVITQQGTVKELPVSAHNAAEARQDASTKGRVLSVKKQREGFGKNRKLSLNDRLIFMQRLASMLASRVSTTEALDVIYHSFSGAVREAARILKDRIANHGEQFADAMAAAGPKYFPDTTVAIIRTGSQGGDLSYAIREAARFERELAAVKKESSKGLYSAFGGFAAGIVTILASTLYVAPEIMNSSFVQVGGEIDMYWTMLTADIITWIAIAFGGTVGGFMLLSLFFRPFSPAMVDRIILKIPYYRDMVLSKSNYMVFFGLAVLLKAGLRIEEALNLSIETSPKGELQNDLIRARQAIREGSVEPWPYVMSMLHPTDKASLATAQDREQIARTIEDLAFQYQALYRARMETIVPILQGFSAVFLSLAGFVLFGVSIIPLMQGSSNVLNAL